MTRQKSRESRPRALRKISERTAREVRGGKRKGSASPRLYEATCKGTHIPEVTIE
jgi:hypothetical protein